jgi:molybdate transport system substrate-binding protein
VAPADSALKIRGPVDLLHRELRTNKIAIADEGVPAGDYARESLATFGVLEPMKHLLVGQKDVRAVLRAVELGEVDAGFVYATDARAAKVIVLCELDPTSHKPVEYLALIPKSAPDKETARAFLQHLQSDKSREALKARGFTLP